ncbi:MAG TPA: Ku protein [Syntrophorhabdaceae bacterium]|nr:Ku protein [Syntrophorhabdaceae bacterium]
MALQSIWTGTITFSLVAIPVRLVKAVRPDRISFRMLHAKDYSPLIRAFYCPDEDRMVPPGEIVRGYEVGPEQYIEVTEDELDSVSPERSRTIEIMDFVDVSDVDPLYYDRPYYLAPGRGGEKAYGLLVQVMLRTNRGGIAKFVLGEREHLVLLRVSGAALSLVTLHYSDEVVPAAETVPEEKEEGGVEEEKDRMARTIRRMEARFDPARYRDDRRRKIMALLGRKEEVEAPVEAPTSFEDTQEGPGDLVAVLQESVRKLKGVR